MQALPYAGFPVFTQVTASFEDQINISQVILQSQVQLNQKQSNNYRLTLNPDSILIYQSVNHKDKPVAFVKLTFQLKFQTIIAYKDNYQQKNKQLRYQLKGFKIINDVGEAVSFYIKCEALTRVWIKQMAKFINVMGFHELYKPIRRLGKGSSSIVYEVINLQSKQTFAAKSFSKDSLRSCSKRFDSFLNEVAILRRLQHKNVLKLEGVFQTDGSYYVLTQILRGGNLLHYLMHRETSLSLRQSRIIMHKLMNGLAQLQKNEIVHRDIKLQNIMLRSNNSIQPIIIDFGLAINSNDQNYVTYQCGTPGYISPDVFGLGFDQRLEPISDVFSAGSIFFTLLTGRYLFEGKEVRTIYQNNKTFSFDLSRPEFKAIDACAFDLLQRMLTINPKQRIKASECIDHNFLREYKPNEGEKILSSPVSTNDGYHY